MNRLMLAIGKKVTEYTEIIFGPLKFIPYTFYSILFEYRNKRSNIKHLFLSEVVYSGVKVLPIIIFFGFFSGAITIYMLPINRISLGIDNIYGYLFSNILIKEFAPFLSSVVVMIRSSISVTIGLSNMKVAGELETLEIIGINPIIYLGTSKILAGIIIIPILTVYFSIAALISYCLFAVTTNSMQLSEILKQISNVLSADILIINFIKAFCNGLIIFTIAIYVGFKDEIKSINVIKNGIQSITTTLFALLIFNILLTAIFDAIQ